ncbi:hypothetical protein [Natronorarus salvus]|uniref:hypothetical protein n=1 Tax=Natronorarus salvus TaxID=3117733 RepID=UPI002F2688FF
MASVRGVGLAPHRVLERLLFSLPLIVGVGIAGVLAERGDPTLDSGLLLVATAAGLCVRLGVPACLLLDARRVRATGWGPRGSLYALAALLLSAPLVGLVYLHRRHRRVPIDAREGYWWVLVAGSLVVALVGSLVAVIAVAIEVPSTAVAVPALAAAVGLGVFPAAIYEDAAYVRSRAGDGWTPNPATYLALAFVGLTIAPLHPPLAFYYLARRRRSDVSRSDVSRSASRTRPAYASATTKCPNAEHTGAMAHNFTEDDEGKKVVDETGEEVGVVTSVEHGTVHVEPDPGITDTISAKLGWGDRDEDTYPLQEESVEAVTDDEIRLGSLDTGTTGTAGTH